MKLSVICPTYNEERYIDQIIEHFINSKPEEKELYIIDGGSTDRTVELIKLWTSNNSNIHLLHNTDKFVAYGLNKAIPLCEGEFIVRIDAHSEYAGDYYSAILNTFNKTGAAIVGGPTRTKAKTTMQSAIGHAICTPMAIGDSSVHFSDYEGYTDSVTFGAWQRDIFKTTGLFDTELVRNQDDEFHYRAKELGLSIYQSPNIILYYYPRHSLKGLFKQYYQYGLYKPLVFRKVRSGMKLRHLIPSLFVLYLFSLPIVFMSLIWLIPLLVYILGTLFFSIKSPASWSVRLRMPLVFPVLHIAYGTGFLIGLVRFSKWLKPILTKPPSI